jgi:aryl-alcohol dehydrogenase-like predicted oxidoreductase
MRYRQLGRSILQVSVIGLGTNNFGVRLDDEPTAARIVATAIENGINFIDTAGDYGKDRNCEQWIGRAIKGHRNEVLIGTKGGGRPVSDGSDDGTASSENIRRAVDASLRALDTDHVDLYQVHHIDPNTPIEETLGVLDDLVQAGKIRAIGSSNFSADHLRESVLTSRAQGIAEMISEQPHYSMLERTVEDVVLPTCRDLGISILPYYPLAAGFLTGKYQRGVAPGAGTRMKLAPTQGDRWLTDAHFDLLDALSAFAEAREHTIAELAFAWLLSEPLIGSVIAGASRPEQVAANAKAGDWILTPEERAEVGALLDAGG